jgi:hypothetical protein
MPARAELASSNLHWAGQRPEGPRSVLVLSARVCTEEAEDRPDEAQGRNRSGRVGNEGVAVRRGPAPLPLPQLMLYLTLAINVRIV